MKIKHIILAFLLGVIVGVVLWVTFPRSHTIETIIPHYIPHYVPTPVNFYIHDTVVATLPVYIIDTVLLTKYDTIKIVEAYLGKVFYSDSVKGNDYELIINDTISQNRIISRQISHLNLKQCDAPTIGFHAGFDAYGGSVWGVMPVVGYQDTKRVYSVGYDPFNKVLKGGVYWKF